MLRKRTIKSYFKHLCDLYYIAYSEKKRIGKQISELEGSNPQDKLMTIKQLIKLKLSEEMRKKYFLPNFSIEELKVEENELDKEYKKYCQKKEELEAEYSFWRQRTLNLGEEVFEIIKILHKNKCQIVITSDKETIVLIEYFYKHSKVYGIINMEEKYLRGIPKKSEICKKFIQACKEKDAKAIEILYKEYL